MRTAPLALLVVLLAPAVAHAQTPTMQDQMSAGARLELAAQRAAAPAPAVHADLLAPERFSSRAPGATLMIIGGASVVAGILIGGSGGALLILGGVGVGAYGFYLYTR
jgi:hypothetical protein